MAGKRPIRGLSGCLSSTVRPSARARVSWLRDKRTSLWPLTHVSHSSSVRRCSLAPARQSQPSRIRTALHRIASRRIPLAAMMRLHASVMRRGAGVGAALMRGHAVAPAMVIGRGALDAATAVVASASPSPCASRWFARAAGKSRGSTSRRFSRPYDPEQDFSEVGADEVETPAGERSDEAMELNQPDGDEAEADAALFARISSRAHKIPPVVADRGFLEQSRRAEMAALHQQRLMQEVAEGQQVEHDSGNNKANNNYAPAYHKRERSSTPAVQSQSQSAGSGGGDYKAYRPYSEPRSATLAAAGIDPHSARSVSSPIKPKYSSSRPSPAHLAFKKHETTQPASASASASLHTSSAPAPAAASREDEGNGAEEEGEEQYGMSRRAQSEARDQSARARYAARHNLGSSAPAATAAATPAPAQQQEETWSIPQPSDWEHAIPDGSSSSYGRRGGNARGGGGGGSGGGFDRPNRDGGFDRRSNDRFDRPSRGGFDRRDSGRDYGRDYGRDRDFGNNNSSANSNRRDSDFTTQRDSDGFNERVGYAPRGRDRDRDGGRPGFGSERGFDRPPRRGGFSDRGYEARDAGQWGSASAPARGGYGARGDGGRGAGAGAGGFQQRSDPAVDRWQQGRWTPSAPAAAAADPAPFAPPPRVRLDGMRGATAAERYAATSFGRDRDPTPSSKWGRGRGDRDDRPAAARDWQGELLYGLHPVLCALQARRRSAFYHLYLQDNKAARLSGRLAGVAPTDLAAQAQLMALANKLQIPHTYLSKHDLNQMSDQRPHNGFALDAAPLLPPILHSAHDFDAQLRMLERQRALDRAGAGDPSLAETAAAPSRTWVLLDEIMDPQNMGAMLRSCLYFNVAGVVICQKNSATLGGVTSKASSGAQEFLHIAYVSSTPRLLHKLDPALWNIVGLSLARDSVDMRDLAQKLAASSSTQQGQGQGLYDQQQQQHAHPSGGKYTLLVVGNEGRGLRPIVAQSCHFLAKIVGAPGAGQPLHLSAEALAPHYDAAAAAQGEADQSNGAPTLAQDNSFNDAEMARAEELQADAERLNREEEAELGGALIFARAQVEGASSANQEQQRSSVVAARPTAPAVQSVSRTFVDSLNVSNALAVALYELSR